MRVEGVVGQQSPALVCDEGHRLDDVAEDGLADEVVEVDPDPAGLDALAPRSDLALELVAAFQVDPEQPMAVRASARAAAPALDPEQVVEDRDDEVVVEVATLRPADDEGHDRQPLGVEVAQDLDAGVLVPGRHGPAQVVLLVRADDLRADRSLELEHQAAADRLDDRRRAALLAVDGIGEVDVLVGVHVGDRPATDHVRHPVRHQVAAHHEDARCAGSADELVR